MWSGMSLPVGEGALKSLHSSRSRVTRSSTISCTQRLTPIFSPRRSPSSRTRSYSSGDIWKSIRCIRRTSARRRRNGEGRESWTWRRERHIRKLMGSTGTCPSAVGGQRATVRSWGLGSHLLLGHHLRMTKTQLRRRKSTRSRWKGRERGGGGGRLRGGLGYGSEMTCKAVHTT